MDEDSMAAFDAAMKRQHDTYGRTAETPRTPYGNLKVSALTPSTPPARPITERISEFCKQLPGVSQQLAYARTRQRESDAFLLQARVQFDKLADDLAQAIAEHREGTPENVPYPR
jgi:hypothetical protein